MMIFDDKTRNNNSLMLFNHNSITSLTSFMADHSFYNQIQDRIDESGETDYSPFNDLEMIYLFVHQQKDLNEKKNRKENTRREYLRDLLIFYKQLVQLSELLSLPIEEISEYKLLKNLTHRHIRKFQEWIVTAPLGKNKKPYSPATLNRKMVIIKSFLTFLYENKYIETPLHQKMKSSHVREIDRPYKDLNVNEVLEILSRCKDHPILYGIVSVLATTGIRIQELCTARVCDLSYVDGDYWLKVNGKGNKEREVLIFPNVLEAIKEFRLRRRMEFKLDRSDTSPLFTTAKGKSYHYKYLSNYVTRKINELDLNFIQMRKTPITPHFFRHAWALISSDQGVSIQQIQESLGHSDIKTTMIYLKRKMARKNNAAHAWKGSDLLKNI